MAESLRSQTVEDPRGGNICETHQEPLQLYCIEDATAICLVCERSQAHRAHTVVPVQAVQEHWVDTEGPRQRFEALASQPQPREPDRRSRGRGVATRSELRECQGREPGSEPAAGKQEETRTHVSEEAPALKHELNQATLDPAVHKISDTREDAEPQVDVKGQRSRFDSPTSPAPWQVSAGDQAGVCPAGQGATQTESGGDTGRRGRESGKRKAAAAGAHRETSPAPAPPKIPKSLPASGTHQQAGVKGVVSRFVRWMFPAPSQVSAGDQAGVSPAGQGAAQTESGGDTGREPGSKREHGRRQASLDPVIHNISNTRETAQSKADAPSRGDSFQGRGLLRSRENSGDSGQVGISPGGRVARPPELQGCAVEVTLDPATAHPRLVLSEDRKSAERGDTWQDLPDNPERFDTSVCVLGSEGFTSGRRYWEVEVGPGAAWILGVARDSVQRKGLIQPKPDLGIWALDSLDVSQKTSKVGVYLDYEGGQVRFYNAENKAQISSHTATFTGRLVPFFRLWTTGSRISLSPCQR